MRAVYCCSWQMLGSTKLFDRHVPAYLCYLGTSKNLISRERIPYVVSMNEVIECPNTNHKSHNDYSFHGGLISIVFVFDL
jgi:hypothetical protein